MSPGVTARRLTWSQSTEKGERLERLECDCRDKGRYMIGRVSLIRQIEENAWEAELTSEH